MLRMCVCAPLGIQEFIAQHISIDIATIKYNVNITRMCRYSLRHAYREHNTHTKNGRKKEKIIERKMDHSHWHQTTNHTRSLYVRASVQFCVPLKVIVLPTMLVMFHRNG